jgi:hypothetical protein
MPEDIGDTCTLHLPPTKALISDATDAAEKA